MEGEVILAIDPGTTETGYAFVREQDFKPTQFGKVSNADMLDICQHIAVQGRADCVVVERLQSYGASIGATVLETAVWTGRFIQALREEGVPTSRVYRKDVKLNLCGKTSAKDANVSRALIERFAPYAETIQQAKGSRSDPGWFYGMAKDMWAAYALGVTVIDLKREGRFEEVAHVEH